MNIHQRWHSKYCKWDGESHNYSPEGHCVGCDKMLGSPFIRKLFRGSYGMGKEALKLFCLSGIKYAKCTKHTNPSCACGKLVLNATA